MRLSDHWWSGLRSASPLAERNLYGLPELGPFALALVLVSALALVLAPAVLFPPGLSPALQIQSILFSFPCSFPSMLPVVRSFLRVVQRVGTVRFMPLVKRTKYGRVIPVRHGVAARALHWRRLGKKHRFAMRIADPASRRVRQLRFAL